MGLDLKKMREQQATINAAAGKGDDDLFLYSNKLKAEEYIKLMPDLKGSLNGSYFVEQFSWWINGKLYVSNKTFGGIDVIEEEVEAAKELAKTDKELDAIIKARNDKKAPLLQRETRFLVPVLYLNLEFANNSDEILSCSVVDDKVKVMVVKPTLMTEIHRIVTSKQYNKKGGWGILDQFNGAIIQVGKEGTGLNTEYFAQGFEKLEDDPIYEKLTDDNYYVEVDGKNPIPDVWKLTKDLQKSDEYLRSVIRNYLYGEPILEEPKEGEEQEQDEAPKQSRRSAAATESKTDPTSRSRAAAKKEDDDDEDDEPAPARRRATTSAKTEGASKSRRNIIDDVESELNDLD